MGMNGRFWKGGVAIIRDLFVRCAVKQQVAAKRFKAILNPSFHWKREVASTSRFYFYRFQALKKYHYVHKHSNMYKCQIAKQWPLGYINDMKNWVTSMFPLKWGKYSLNRKTTLPEKDLWHRTPCSGWTAVGRITFWKFWETNGRDH